MWDPGSSTSTVSSFRVPSVTVKLVNRMAGVLDKHPIPVKLSASNVKQIERYLNTYQIIVYFRILKEGSGKWRRFVFYYLKRKSKLKLKNLECGWAFI